MSVLTSDSRTTASQAAASNVPSTVNSQASTTLAEGSSLTGSWEACGAFAAVTVIVQATSTDKIGWLIAEFASDAAGTTVVCTRRSRIMDEQLNRVFMCPVVGAYWRLSFQASTVIDNRATPAANTFTGLTISTFMYTKAPFVYDFVLGRRHVRLQGYDSYTNNDRIVGANAAATLATVPLPTSNTTIRVHSSQAGNAVGQTGAQTFLVVGINASYAEVYLKGDFQGTSSTPTASTSSFIRVNEFKILTYGSAQAPASSSVLTVKMSISGTYYAVVALDTASGYKYDMAMYSVPYGFTAYLMTGYVTPSYSTAPTSMRLSTVKAGTRQAVPLVYNVACSQLEFLYPELTTYAGSAGDTVVAESASANALVVSVDFVLTLISS
jgi:hypothetical protein